MRKTLKKGFTLIELMVVIAIIGILATTLAPKLREQLAKAKDAKAISLLGATRTAASAILIDDSVAGNPGENSINWTTLVSHMDVTTQGLVKDGLVKIGGSRDKNTKTLVYNGKVQMVYQTTAGAGTYATIDTNVLKTNMLQEASDIHLGAKNTVNTKTVTAEENSTENKAWLDY